MKNIILIFLTVCFSIACTRNQSEPENDEVTKIERKVFTESGDWGGSLEYTYGSDGNLRHIKYVFGTFSGFDKDLEDFRSTNCVREYDVISGNKLVLKSTVTTDMETGKEVAERSFYEPEFAHWMTLKEARQAQLAEEAEKAEQ